jgi:hypothetical protein
MTVELSDKVGIFFGSAVPFDATLCLGDVVTFVFLLFVLFVVVGVVLGVLLLARVVVFLFLHVEVRLPPGTQVVFRDRVVKRFVLDTPHDRVVKRFLLDAQRCLWLLFDRAPVSLGGATRRSATLSFAVLNLRAGWRRRACTTRSSSKALRRQWHL